MARITRTGNQGTFSHMKYQTDIAMCTEDAILLIQIENLPMVHIVWTNPKEPQTWLVICSKLSSRSSKIWKATLLGQMPRRSLIVCHIKTCIKWQSFEALITADEWKIIVNWLWKRCNRLNVIFCKSEYSINCNSIQLISFQNQIDEILWGWLIHFTWSD